jgi:glycosyltransferase involved in cell wall biosynthesis
MKDITRTHTFVVPAFGKSPYLEACIASLQNQKLVSRVILVTSTPNAYISEIAEKYHIALYINEGEAGISGDWNFQESARFIHHCLRLPIRMMSIFLNTLPEFWRNIEG